jgi:hypothetical protein
MSKLSLIWISGWHHKSYPYANKREAQMTTMRIRHRRQLLTSFLRLAKLRGGFFLVADHVHETSTDSLAPVVGALLTCPIVGTVRAR